MSHCSTMYIDVDYCYRRSSVVCQSVGLSICRSVCHTSEPCKKRLNRLRCRLGWDSGRPREPCIRWGLGSRCPMARGNFEGKRCLHTCHYNITTTTERTGI